jgi:hypothetical protein
MPCADACHPPAHPPYCLQPRCAHRMHCPHGHLTGRPTGRACSGGTEQPALPQPDGRTDSMRLERDCRSQPLLLDCWSTAQTRTSRVTQRTASTAAQFADTREGHRAQKTHPCPRASLRVPSASSLQSASDQRVCLRLIRPCPKAAAQRGHRAAQSSAGEKARDSTARGGEQQGACTAGSEEREDSDFKGALCCAPGAFWFRLCHVRSTCDTVAFGCKGGLKVCGLGINHKTDDHGAIYGVMELARTRQGEEDMGHAW